MKTLPVRTATLACCLLPCTACDGTSAPQACPPGHVQENGVCVIPVEPDIALDSVGFLPDRPKVATVRRPGSGFEIRSAADDSVVYSGPLEGPRSATDTGEEVFVADLTDFAETGEYTLHVDDLEPSATFRIGTDVFGEALRAAMLGLYGQRCGTAVTFEYAGNTFSHGACHQEDGTLAEPRGDQTEHDTTGGWHDAGDYGKYTINGAFSVGYMLKAWEHFEPALTGRAFELPEAGDVTPDFLDEARWQVEWVARMQFDDGSVSDIVTTAGFANTVLPEHDAAMRFVGATGTRDAAAAVAVLAQASRLFAPHDPGFEATCLEGAWLSYQYLLDHPEEVRADVSGFGVGNYSGGNGYRLWAAAELWESTGDADVLAALEGQIWNADTGSLEVSVRRNWDWADAEPLGLFTYLLSERDGRTLAAVDALTANLTARADELADAADANGYGRNMPDVYYWGSNGVLLRTCMTLEVAARLTGETRYRDAALAQLDHVLGRNVFARSYVTGVGHRPASAPHHRPSMSDRVGEPWPGLLIGGPNDQEGTYAHEGLAWIDSANNYYTNEIAINWNAALIYALAAWVESP